MYLYATGNWENHFCMTKPTFGVIKWFIIFEIDKIDRNVSHKQYKFSNLNCKIINFTFVIEEKGNSSISRWQNLLLDNLRKEIGRGKKKSKFLFIEYRILVYLFSYEIYHTNCKYKLCTFSYYKVSHFSLFPAKWLPVQNPLKYATQTMLNVCMKLCPYLLYL